MTDSGKISNAEMSRCDTIISSIGSRLSGDDSETKVFSLLRRLYERKSTKNAFERLFLEITDINENTIADISDSDSSLFVSWYQWIDDLIKDMSQTRTFTVDEAYDTITKNSYDEKIQFLIDVMYELIEISSIMYPSVWYDEKTGIIQVVSLIEKVIGDANLPIVEIAKFTMEEEWYDLSKINKLVKRLDIDVAQTRNVHYAISLADALYPIGDTWEKQETKTVDEIENIFIEGGLAEAYIAVKAGVPLEDVLI